MQVMCPRCKETIDQADCYCRRCGKSLKPGWGFFYGPAGVILLTLIVGPFSLITLWLSKRMNKRSKLIFTVGITLFTLYAVYMTYQSVLLLTDALQVIAQGGFNF